MATIGRWSLRVPDGGDEPDVPADFERLATDLSNVAMDTQGTLAARPVSTTLAPSNKPGRFYTDSNGTIYRDNGSGWVVVGGRMPRMELGVNVILPNNAGAGPLPVAVTEVTDVWGMHDPADDSEFTVPASGLWLLAARYSFPANATGARYVDFVSGATVLADEHREGQLGANPNRSSWSFPVVLAENAPVTFRAAQDSGGVLSFTATVSAQMVAAA